MANGKYAVAIMNIGATPCKIGVAFDALGLSGRFDVRDAWLHQQVAKGAKKWRGMVNSHQTKVFVLSNRR
jgi:hypothetical protein